MLALAALVLLQAASAEIRSLTVSITDEKGAPVSGVITDEIAVVENGAAREVTKVELDERPLTLAVIVDTSQAVGSDYRLNVVEAVTRLIARLPAGARYALWTTGDRPTKIVDLTDDPARAAPALKRAITTGGNTLLDAIGEAARDLKEAEGARTMVVIVTGVDPELGNTERHRVVEQARTAQATFSAIQFDTAEARFEDRTVYEFVLSSITKESGGLYETLLTPMGVGQALDKIASDLKSQYRVSYATLSEVKNPKLEVKIARPQVKVRLAKP